MLRSVIVLAVLVTVSVAPTSAASAAKTTVTVPVIVCPTTLGVNNPPTPVPAAARVPAAAAHLAVYSATSAAIQLLGPTGWACQAGIGADGSSSITAVPPDRRIAINDGGVAALIYPACQGCMLTLACPFFPVAMRQLHHEAVLPCGPQPLGQVVHHLSPWAVALSDPPGEAIPKNSGGLVPSDSLYPTNGVVVYGAYTWKQYHVAVAMEAVCVLPASKHSTCTAVLDEFLSAQAEKFGKLSAVS
jgi:Domain of unknown function (DUF4850)